MFEQSLVCYHIVLMSVFPWEHEARVNIFLMRFRCPLFRLSMYAVSFMSEILVSTIVCLFLSDHACLFELSATVDFRFFCGYVFT